MQYNLGHEGRQMSYSRPTCLVMNDVNAIQYILSHEGRQKSCSTTEYKSSHEGRQKLCSTYTWS